MREAPVSWAAVIVAAGRGTRFGRPKQLVEIAGEPMLCWSLRVFASMEEVTAIVVVTERDWLQDVASLAESCSGGKWVAAVPGGATRQRSTYEGLCAVPDGCDGVFVHDGARPLIVAREVRAGMRPVCAGHGSLLAVPVVDTIKTVDPATNTVVKTLERSTLWAAQTPQFATTTDMRAAHEAAIRSDVDATDDANLLERAGVLVHVVPGSVENFKVTVPEDHRRADRAMRARLTSAGELR
ncbi:MAG TPA: 2-C-methyl-D-erythritol 4-phosphate cytidylyltransferase [Candidatus Baltobacteraceae bacterium]|jgi:2-C-methyl-D-erythritol 4-phosphate cytidylyltransferase|nr:2-C-methyl-D-erythritol 4-phosphate cytidylyltransferase [Candidatus Baltobacteraceae bacterium]